MPKYNYKTPSIWNFFKNSGDDKTAICNYCSKEISYKTTLISLRLHLKMEHQSVYDDLIVTEQLGFTVTHEKNERKTRKWNLPIWNFFEKSGERNRTAYCNCCSKKLSYKSTITNLKSHLKTKHNNEYEHFLKLTERYNLVNAQTNSMSENDESEMTFENQDIGNNSPTPTDSDHVLWTFFEKSNDETQTASCNNCSKKLSYGPELSVLKEHLKIEHTSEYNNFLNLVEHIESSPEDVVSVVKVVEKEEIDNGSPTFVIETVESGPNSPSTSAHENISSDNEKTKNFNRNGRPCSRVWLYFKKSDERNKIADCNNCSKAISYKSTITNLKHHLKQKHRSDYDKLLSLKDQLESGPENSPQSKRCDRSPLIWNFFEKSRSGNRTAICNYCSKRLSYRSTVANLKAHLNNSHSAEYSIYCKLNKQMNSDNTFEDSASEVENTEKSVKKGRRSRSNGIIWNFFEESNSGHRIAVCNYCSGNISYKTTITNLKNHLKVRHKSAYDVFVKWTDEHRDVENRLENSTADVEMENVRLSTSETGGIWKHFTRSKHDQWIANCNYCGSSYHSKIINLITHLKDEHNEIYKEYTELGGGSKSRKRRHSSMSSASNLGGSDRASGSDGDLPHERLVLRKTSYNEASNSNEQDTLLMPPDAIKRRISTNVADENATEQDQEAEKDDVWNYFEKIPSNRAQCILCKETFNRHVPFLAKHLSEKHRKVALDLPSDSDDDQNCYTEVVYLEEEQPLDVATKLKKVKQVPEPKKRRTSSRYEFANKPKDDEINSKNEVDDEIENFGRYVIGLLKKLPKDVSTQLQMDIISMIMTAKLKIQTPTTENVTVSSVQFVTPGNDIVTTPGNVIVTTPSNVIHTTQNNESLPTLVIGVQKES